MSAASPVEVEPTQTPDEITLVDKPWVTIVWNDPVNLMSYVTYVFQKYFGYEKAKAEKLMLEVHTDGKSAVSHGTREEMERDVQAMHEYGLWATMEKPLSSARRPVSGFARHRRSGHVIATFTGFEADLLRSLASQLVELLRNEAAVPADDLDPFESLMDFCGPTTEPEDPVLARLFPTAYSDDEEAAAEFRRYTEAGLRDGKAAAAAPSSTPWRRPGCRPSSPRRGWSSTSSSTSHRGDLDADLHRPPAGARHPARGRGG